MRSSIYSSFSILSFLLPLIIVRYVVFKIFFMLLFFFLVSELELEIGRFFAFLQMCELLYRNSQISKPKSTTVAKTEKTGPIKTKTSHTDL